jgi:N-acetylglucosaminyl-diphospho-decaprenol L-rhamnosyltransferase
MTHNLVGKTMIDSLRRFEVSLMDASLAEADPCASDGAEPARVDVVIVAYNSRDTLRVCIEPLVRLPWVDVTVVDNACPEHSAGVVADLPVRIVRSPRNGGFAYGCNLGIANGSADFVLFLNPDAEIDAASLAVLVDALRADASLGGVGPHTIDAAGNVIFTQRRFPRLRFTYAEGLFVHRAAPGAAWADDQIRDPEAYERPGTAEWISGCCMLLRREAIASVGGLDEGFFLYSEEVDLFKRLATAGWRAGFETRATARHIGYQSADRDATERIRAVSRVRYVRKHHGRLVAALEASGVALGALVRAVVWIRRPARARGNLLAARAAIRALRSAT